ncbi:MAG TPA: response regulator [Candidatus Sulfotelmatobacter sp.]|nr:response regulator [Candidatus Sulfotelmatobacter sp.]
MPNETILLVDDDPMLLQFCRDILEPAGYKTICLEEGDNLPAVVASVHPAIIFLDIIMPGPDGLSLCQQLRSGATSFRGPIVIISAKHYRADRELASEVGANAFLPKPFSAERLLTVVQDFLSRKVTVRFWGVRGSIPTASRETIGYGGNTPCIEVRLSGAEDIFILDGGTGLRELGRSLRGEGNITHGYLCFSHYHWDHIQGLPFFEPAYIPGNAFTLVGPAQPTADLLQVLSGQMASVYFPVGLEQFGARLSFEEIDEGSVTLGGVHFDTLSSIHPGRALIYRIIQDDKRIVYATDNELPAFWKARGGPTTHEVSRFLRFFADADLLIHDAQFTPEELERRHGWGHSSWTDVLDIAVAARVKQLMLFHHDPDHSDTFLDAIHSTVQQRIDASGLPITCGVAREGDCIIL